MPQRYNQLKSFKFGSPKVFNKIDFDFEKLPLKIASAFWMSI